MDGLKWKPPSKRVRIIYGDGERLSGMDHVKKNPGKVFAVIGPFDDHCDKGMLQDSLEFTLRGYNLEPRGGP